MKKIKLNAFVTIEYTLLLPVLLLLYTFLVYVGVFWYNECILHTNIRILGIEASHLPERDAEQKLAILEQKAAQVNAYKYLLAEQPKTEYRLRGSQIEITGRGEMGNPLYMMGIGKETWNLTADCKITVLSPVNTLRLCKATRDFLDKEAGEMPETNNIWGTEE